MPEPKIRWRQAYHTIVALISKETGMCVYGDPSAFDGMTTDDMLAWLRSVEAQWGEAAALELAQALGLEHQVETDPDLVARVQAHISRNHALVAAVKMVTDIGDIVGRAADAMVAAHYGLETLVGTASGRGVPKPVTPGPFEPVLEAPHLDPELVWNISRAYWHEIVYRGMEIGVREPFHITGLEEFSYDEVLVFAQHIWLAFKKVTGLDFTIPIESKLIKFWLGLSEKYPGREHAPDVSSDTIENKINRLRHYIDHGGPSHKLMEKTGESEPPPDDGFYMRNYETGLPGGD